MFTSLEIVSVVCLSVYISATTYLLIFNICKEIRRRQEKRREYMLSDAYKEYKKYMIG